MDHACERPGRPIVDIRLDFIVDEPIGERCRHRIGDAPIAVAIACGENEPARRYAIFAKPSIKDQLIGRRGDRGHRRGDFIQKQDTTLTMPLAIRQQCRDGPDDVATIAKRDPAQIGRLHLGEAQIDQANPRAGGRRGDDAGLAHARRPPNHDGRVIAGRAGDFALDDAHQCVGTHRRAI